MDAFPAFIPLAGKTVVVAGDGEAAEAKARLFLSGPARIVRLSREQALDPHAYAEAVLAFIAGDERFAIKAAAAGRQGGALVNVVDRPQLSDFYTPGIVDRGTVVGAIGTGGAAPVLATQLRTALEAQWPPGLGRVADLLRRLQPEARARLPETGPRRAFLRGLVGGPAAEAAMAGEMDEAVTIARAALRTPSVRQGVVWLIPLPPSADLITLRALRALGRVDRVVCSIGEASVVLAFARRDAVRVAEAEVSLAALALWTQDGEEVAWLSAGEPPIIQQARELGVTVLQTDGS